MNEKVRSYLGPVIAGILLLAIGYGICLYRTSSAGGSESAEYREAMANLQRIESIQRELIASQRELSAGLADGAKRSEALEARLSGIEERSARIEGAVSGAAEKVAADRIENERRKRLIEEGIGILEGDAKGK